MNERRHVENLKEKLSEKIMQLRTEMDKNKDQLNIFEGHKEFLMGIYEEY